MCDRCARVVEKSNWRDEYTDDNGNRPGTGTSGGEGFSHLYVWCSDGRYAACTLRHKPDCQEKKPS